MMTSGMLSEARGGGAWTGGDGGAGAREMGGGCGGGAAVVGMPGLTTAGAVGVRDGGALSAVAVDGFGAAARGGGALSAVVVDGFFFFSSRRRHTRCLSDWSSDVCSSD